MKSATILLNKATERMLILSVHKMAFEVMVTGEKDREYRKPSQWIKSRVFGHDAKITHIKIINGYGAHRPYFIAELNNFWFNTDAIVRVFSNGLVVDVEKDDYIFVLGNIIEKGNLERIEKTA